MAGAIHDEYYLTDQACIGSDVCDESFMLNSLSGLGASDTPGPEQSHSLVSFPQPHAVTSVVDTLLAAKYKTTCAALQRRIATFFSKSCRCERHFSHSHFLVGAGWVSHSRKGSSEALLAEVRASNEEI